MSTSRAAPVPPGCDPHGDHRARGSDGLGGELGSIEPGKLADLIVVDGNPLVNIVDIRRTRRVIKDGKVYDVDALVRGPTRQGPSSRE